LNEDVESRLLELKAALSLDDSQLQRTGTWDRMVKSAMIRDVLNGLIPKRVSFDGNLPFNFQKGEEVVWAFQHADYLEDIKRREYVGGSQGVSVRVMKGVYYHVGAFKGHTVQRTERSHIDTGLIAVT